MPTTAQIKKAFKDKGFFDGLKNLGFEIGPNAFWAYRWRGDFLDVIHFWPIASGNALRIPLSCWVSEMIDDYDMSEFPKGFTKEKSTPLGKFLVEGEGVCYSQHAWSLRGEPNTDASVKGILSAIERDALPYFNSIDSKRALLSQISPSVMDGPAGEKYRNILGK